MLKTQETSRVDLIGLESPAAGGDIHVGDMVRTGSNRFPHYAVIALYEGMAWVRDTQTGAYGLTSLDLCHRIEGEA